MNNQHPTSLHFATLRRNPVRWSFTGAILSGIMLATVGLAAHADVVTDWNQTALRATEIAAMPPPVQARAMAIVQNNGVRKLKMLTRPSQDLSVKDLDKKAAGIK